LLARSSALPTATRVDSDDLLAVADRTLTTELAQQVADAYSDVVVFPPQRIIEGADDEERYLPGWPDPVLLLSQENQGVCSGAWTWKARAPDRSWSATT
jgi:hypothetical protein